MDGEVLWMACRWKEFEIVITSRQYLDAVRATWQAGAIKKGVCRVVCEATAIHVPQQCSHGHTSFLFCR
jgi:hypothetical protein